MEAIFLWILVAWRAGTFGRCLPITTFANTVSFVRGVGCGLPRDCLPAAPPWCTLLHTHTGTLHTNGRSGCALPGFSQLPPTPPTHTVSRHTTPWPPDPHTHPGGRWLCSPPAPTLLWDTTALFCPGLRNLPFLSGERGDSPKIHMRERSEEPCHSGLWPGVRGQLCGIPISSQHACFLRDRFSGVVRLFGTKTFLW